jgi:hypothetical protein
MGWIFQSNPKRFNLDEYLAKNHALVYWWTPFHQREITQGDLAFIWRAGRHAGVVAFGSIAEGPVHRFKVKSPESLADELWYEQAPDSKEQTVGIALTEVRLTQDMGMLRRQDLSKDSIFSKHPIITAPRRTVFPLDSSAEQRLLLYWQGGI